MIRTTVIAHVEICCTKQIKSCKTTTKVLIADAPKQEILRNLPRDADVIVPIIPRKMSTVRGNF